MFKLVEKRHLLVMAVFQLVQRLADRIDIALAQQFANQLHLAAAALFLDALRQLNGRAQIVIQRDLIEGVLAQVYHLCAEAF